MTNRCPDCGVPLDEIPFDECAAHRAYERDARNAERRRLAARPIWEKIEQSGDFEELKDHLAAWTRELAP